MKPFRFFSSHFAAGILLALCGLMTSAFAGPPLICHRLDIGDAKSLPWNGTAWDLAGNENYDTRNLVHDTLAILDGGVPVIVRMETLRRATLYARKDPQAAKELLTKLYQRAMAGEAAGHSDALAWFDAGYLAAAYRQGLGKDQNPAAGIDGYDLVSKALSRGGEKDPQMQFAAALITLQGPEQAHQEHAQKAIAGAKNDPLLARNLANHFLGNEKQTVSEALARNVTPGGVK
ncbi:MAG TPA: hypothetical protein VKE93_07100 [Candidatus Angelobacter sp.]|nr:hypothetical protein [Candidatus Angelobacter sp.]